jgi:type IV pilus assembly protein PilP
MVRSDRLHAAGLHLGLERVLAGLALVVLAGCSGGDLSDLQSYVTEVKSRNRGVIEPLPVIQKVEPFSFPANTLQDPFVRPQEREDASDPVPLSAVRPDVSRPKEELESYELDSLRMVGTVQLQGGRWGLVKAADGTIHRVRTGNHLGRNYGRVVQVTKDRIELIEVVPDRPGSWQEREAALELIETAANDAGGNTR